MRVRERATPELIECPRPPSSNQNIQMKRHRRERRRSGRPTNVPGSAIININNDIEEQLRIQRLKKNKTEASTSSTTRLPNDDAADTSQMVLGNYTFDPQRNAYFPTATRTTTVRHDHTDDVSTITEPPPPFPRSIPHRYRTIPFTTTTTSPTTLTYLLQLLHGTTQRRQLLATHGYGPLLLHHMSIRAVRASQADGRILVTNDHHHAPRWHNNHGSALWTRTFDMIPLQYYHYSHPHHSQSPMRCSAAKFVSYTRPFIHGKMLRPAAFRHWAATDPECIVGCLEPTGTSSTTQLHMHDYQRQTSCSLTIPLECNDFTTIHQQSSSSTIHRILLGGTASRCATMDLNRMEVWVDHHGRPSFHTKSDILCMEASSSSDGGSSSTSHRPGDLVFFGHRNGLVQVLDTRTDAVQRIGKLAIGHLIPHGNGNGDSVLGIQALFRERPDQLLTRGRSCWMLWDLRRMSGSGNRSSSAAIVQNVSLFTNSNPSIPGKGMATDPMQTVVIVPFQNEQHQATTHYGVNVWSLDTGDHLGQKLISAPSRSPLVPPSEMELCSTISPAWSRANDADPDYYDISTTSYGLWLRLGHLDSGILHHITCDGRWTYP